MPFYTTGEIGQWKLKLTLKKKIEKTLRTQGMFLYKYCTVKIVTKFL